MVRTIISLDQQLKRRLDARAKQMGVPMAEVVREAVAEYLTAPAAGEDFAEALRRTRGTWRRGDGLAWQRKLRSEWGQ